MSFDGSGVGYNGETRTKLGISGCVVFESLQLKNCDRVWLGGVGRKENVTAENCPYLVAYDLYENKTKGSTAPVLTGVTLSEQEGNSNDDDLFEDVAKEKAIGKDTAKIGTLTTAQLSHHSYDWENGEVTDDATELTYGVLRYTCTDVCDDYMQHTDEHPHSFDCDGVYVYAPLVGLTFDDNVVDSNGCEGEPQEFNKPTVSYEVKGPAGSTDRVCCRGHDSGAVLEKKKE